MRCEERPLAREASLDQIPRPCNPKKGPSTVIFPQFVRAWLANRACPPSLCELRRGSLCHFWLAEPKQRSCEAWRPGLDLNQDKGRCTVLASTPFRHRAKVIIAHRGRAGHRYRQLTLTNGVSFARARDAPRTSSATDYGRYLNARATP